MALYIYRALFSLDRLSYPSIVHARPVVEERMRTLFTGGTTSIILAGTSVFIFSPDRKWKTPFLYHHLLIIIFIFKNYFRLLATTTEFILKLYNGLFLC